MKHITKLILLATLALTLLLTACAVEDKSFTKDGMTITLNSRYSELQQEGYTVAYGATDSVVLVLKETYDSLSAASLDKNSTLTEYANVVIKNNSLTNVSVETKDGLTCFQYDSEVDGKTYSYLAAVYKSTDAFWMIQFSAEKDNYDEKESDFITFAKSVSFAK